MIKANKICHLLCFERKVTCKTKIGTAEALEWVAEVRQFHGVHFLTAFQEPGTKLKRTKREKNVH